MISDLKPELEYAWRFLAKRKLSSLVFPLVLGACAALVGLLWAELSTLSTAHVRFLTSPVHSVFIVDEMKKNVAPSDGLVTFLNDSQVDGLRLVASNTGRSEVYVGGSGLDASLQAIHFEVFDAVDPSALRVPFTPVGAASATAVVSARFENRLKLLWGSTDSVVGSIFKVGSVSFEVVNVVNSPLRFDASGEDIDVWVPWRFLADAKGLPKNLIDPDRPLNGTHLIALGQEELVQDEMFWLDQAARAEGLLSNRERLVHAGGFHNELTAYEKNRQLVRASLVTIALLMALAVGSYLKLRLVVAGSQARTYTIRHALGAFTLHQMRQIVVLNGILLGVACVGAFGLLAAIDTGVLGLPLLSRSSSTTPGMAYVVGGVALLGLSVLVVGAEWMRLQGRGQGRGFLRFDQALGNLAALLFGACLLANVQVLLDLATFGDVDYGFRDESIAVVDVKSKEQIFEGTGIRLVTPMNLIEQSLAPGGQGYDLALASRAPLDDRPVDEDLYFFPLEESRQPTSIGVMYVDRNFFSVTGIEVAEGDVPLQWSDGSILVNETLAKRYFGDTSPIGQQLFREFFDIVVSEDGGMRTESPKRYPFTIVAVVNDFHLQSRRIPAAPLILAPLIDQNEWRKVLVGAPPGRSLDEVSGAVDIEGRTGTTVTGTRWLSELVDQDLAEERTRLSISWFQGSLSVLLFALMVYVYLSEILQKNRRALGIWSALGAVPGRLSVVVMKKLLSAAVPGFLLALAFGPIIGDVVSPLDKGSHSFQAVLGAAAVFAGVFLAFVTYGTIVIRRATGGDEINSWIT